MGFKKINLQKIENEIEKFESKVNFEFIPILSVKSSYIEHVPWVLSLIFILLFSVTIELLNEYYFYNSWHNKTLLNIGLFLFSIMLSSFLNRFDVIKRLFISQHERNRQVHEKAQMIFFSKRLSEIKSHNALLLYISILERRIVILPDPNIKVEGLNEITNQAVSLLKISFRKKDYEQGLIEVIHFLQEKLQSRYPHLTKTKNIFSNKLTWWE